MTDESAKTGGGTTAEPRPSAPSFRPAELADLPRPFDYFLRHLRALALSLRAAVLGGLRATSQEELARALGERGGDVIYRLDEHGEGALLDYCARWGDELPFVLVAEGLDGGRRVFPSERAEDEATFTLIVDPIDGTRGLMYGKRSAWALFGIAPTQGRPVTPARVADISVALQAELPTARAALADVLWAVRGGGAHGETHDLRSGEVMPFTPRPSTAETLTGGFAAISKFFPGQKAAAAALEEHLFLELLGPPTSASPQVFDDEYICTGGQFYELMVGHDRFLADLRPLLHDPHEGVSRLCCHPYDVATALIAREAGVIISDPWGNALVSPLDTESPVAWVGYANATLRERIEPALQRLLRQTLARLHAGAAV
jgi:hypothetical protein